MPPRPSTEPSSYRPPRRRGSSIALPFLEPEPKPFPATHALRVKPCPAPCSGIRYPAYTACPRPARPPIPDRYLSGTRPVRIATRRLLVEDRLHHLLGDRRGQA